MSYLRKSDNGHNGNNLRNHKLLASALMIALVTLLGCQASPTGSDVVKTQERDTQYDPPQSGQADLLIANMHISPTNPRLGDEITFRVFVRNAGNEQSIPSTLRFKVGGESHPPEAPVPSLAPGQEHQYERRLTLDVAQNYVATATADARSQVSESNEGNNVDSKSFTVAAGAVQGHPDLVISNINHSPGSPAAGDEITFWAFVRNVGNAQAGASTIRFKVGGETIPPEAPIPALAPGQEHRYERKVTLSVAQNYLATATADALGQVAESDENNNVLTHNFTVGAAQGQADLRIRIINFSPGSPTTVDEITFWVFVKNYGSASAGGSRLRFQVGGESNPPVVPVPGLAPGQEYRYTRQLTLNVAQNYLATATADALGQVAESDESNNVLTRNFTVGAALGQADLRIRIINFSPGKPKVGDEITFWVFVKNYGSAAAGASRLRFKVGGESNPPIVSIPGLAPGQEQRYTRKLTLNVAQGYLATATADAFGQVAESNESNNVRTKSFVVTH